MRNALTIPFHGSGQLIIASDNSGAIGMKKDDLVHVQYEIVAYYSFRVAVMECIAAGGEPISVILDNFCGNEAWRELTKGIRQGLTELQLKNVAITGSTESNFPLQQSAIGMMVIGKASFKKEIKYPESLKIAVIGKPLVGNEVIEQPEQIAPLSIFRRISRLAGVIVWPVGSKGVLTELNQIYKNSRLQKDNVFSEIDILKSSGPATCFLVLYEEGMEAEIIKMAGDYYHALQLNDALM